jgi:hypothetical protein
VRSAPLRVEAQAISPLALLGALAAWASARSIDLPDLQVIRSADGPALIMGGSLGLPVANDRPKQLQLQPHRCLQQRHLVPALR